MAEARSIILVDGDSRRRAAVSHLLSGRGIHVEPFESAGELAGRSMRQDLALVHDTEGAVTALTDNLVRSGRWLPMIAFGEEPAPKRIVNAILAGAIDYVVWPFAADELTAAIAGAQDRANGIGSARLREATARSRIERLSPREREVLSGVASGQSNRAIAERLNISPRTVEIHRANMLQKIGAAHTSEAIRVAIEASLVSEKD